MILVCQIGYSKAAGGRKAGQRISVFVDDVECTLGSEGKYLTSFLEGKKGQLWYFWKDEVRSGAVIRLEVQTGVVGVGQDERRTFDAVYVMDDSVAVQELNVQGVGYKGYPLLKGRFRELGSVSGEDRREAEIDTFLADENF